MTHKLGELENPYIQVVWEDDSSNFSQERIKSIKEYFQKKYSSQNVNIITKLKTQNQEDQQVTEVALNILDKDQQKNMIRSYLESKSQQNYLDQILEIDKNVESRILLNSEDNFAFRKWYIKKIEFSNFLSYGENQVVDFTRLDGITAVESNPPNFGGKTVLSVDLLLFLFFNTTTKTSKAEEIFNRFTDKNKVSVSGEISIDGEDYLIVRNLERKLSKSGEWNVKTELDFFKKLPNGELQNFTGEQRRETEKFIKTSIGEQEDFLMTILTTASNLEDLLEAKPTARGQVLSKFLGLDFLKRKEETAKEIFSEFSKQMVSNVYSHTTLTQENENMENRISTIKSDNQNIQTEIELVSDSISKGEAYKVTLLTRKHTDIDHKLSILNPTTISDNIRNLETEYQEQKRQFETIVVKEPSEFYDEETHDQVKKQIKIEYGNSVQLQTEIKEIEKLRSSVSGGIKCEHCGIDLLTASLTANKLGLLDGLIIRKQAIDTLLNDLSFKDQTFVSLKKEFDEYEKNKLIREKFEAKMESIQMKISNEQETHRRYLEQQTKIEENRKTDQLIMKSDTRLSELNREKSQYERTLGSNQQAVIDLESRLKKNMDLIIKIGQEFEREKVYKMYLEIFGKNGISKIIMKTMMPIINSELTRLLQDSAYFKLEIRISDKNEVEFVMTDNSTGIEKLMISGSGYEKTIASLALRAVLSKVCSLPKPNIIVFDEVFGKISNENLEMVGEFFTKIKEYFEKIFVITHNPLVTNWADNILKIEKQGNVSRVCNQSS
jgi:DNA repair exonuclease SbcCD ATPase subunit